MSALNVEIEPGTIKQQPLGTIDSNGFDMVHGVSNEAWDLIFHRATDSHGDDCFRVQVWSDNDPGYLQVSRSLRDLRTFPVNATFYFYSLEKGNELRQTFSTIGTVARRNSDRCQQEMNNILKGSATS